MKYGVIVADPPWAFGDRLQKMKSKTKRSAASQYKVMSATDVASLDIRSLADPTGCVLALWVPSTLLIDGLNVMHAWGFTYKTMHIWVKTSKKGGLAFGMGRLMRQCHEVALIGTCGKVYGNVENHSQRSVSMAPNLGHSIKPACLQNSLDLIFPNSTRLEMFARRVRPNWECIGDAIDGKDIAVAIQDLIDVHE